MKIVICGNYGVFNIGDEAILVGLKKTVREIAPKAEIAVMGKGFLLPLGFRSFFKSLFIRKLWKPLYTIKTCNVFVLGGGGLFTDEEGFFISTFWALHVLIAHWFKKPVLILGISLGHIKFWNKWLVKKAIRFAKVVTVRDKNSCEKIKNWRKDCFLTSDFAFLYNYGVLIKKHEKKYVVFSLRNFKNFNKKLHKKIARLCDEIISRFGFQIRFMSFQKGIQNDEMILNKIFTLSKHKEQIIFEKFTLDFNEIVNIFHNAEAVFAMRLHAGIFSLISQTPFIPLAYMSKVNNFWNEFPVIKPLFLNQFDVDDFMRLLQNILSHQNNYQASLTDIKHHLIQRSLMNKKIISDSLKKLTKE